MARNMVTRTVHGTKVTMKVVDTTTEQIVEDAIVLNKGYSEIDDALKKAVSKAIPSDKILVSISAIENIDKCYGIPVADFMAQAIEIDPATRTAIETETEVE